jgi:hypothetical protein
MKKLLAIIVIMSLVLLGIQSLQARKYYYSDDNSCGYTEITAFYSNPFTIYGTFIVLHPSDTFRDTHFRGLLVQDSAGPMVDLSYIGSTNNNYAYQLKADGSLHFFSHFDNATSQNDTIVMHQGSGVDLFGTVNVLQPEQTARTFGGLQGLFTQHSGGSIIGWSYLGTSNINWSSQIHSDGSLHFFTLNDNGTSQTDRSILYPDGNQTFTGKSSSTHARLQGTSGGYVRRSSEATTGAMSGSSATISVNIPEGARIIGVQFRVDTLITSAAATSWEAVWTNTATTAIGSGKAFTKNTKFDFVRASAEKTTGVAQITITPNTGTFTAGVIRAIAYYETIETMDDAS